VPALQPFIIEPIWEQFSALLPERKASAHSLGCHKPRIPARVVFEKVVDVLVFGCAYCRSTTRNDLQPVSPEQFQSPIIPAGKTNSW
jgi:protein-arginine kinase activator protein McsA